MIIVGDDGQMTPVRQMTPYKGANPTPDEGGSFLVDVEVSRESLVYLDLSQRRSFFSLFWYERFLLLFSFVFFSFLFFFFFFFFFPFLYVQ